MHCGTLAAQLAEHQTGNKGVAVHIRPQALQDMNQQHFTQRWNEKECEHEWLL